MSKNGISSVLSWNKWPKMTSSNTGSFWSLCNRERDREHVHFYGQSQREWVWRDADTHTWKSQPSTTAVLCRQPAQTELRLGVLHRVFPLFLAIRLSWTQNMPQFLTSRVKVNIILLHADHMTARGEMGVAGERRVDVHDFKGNLDNKMKRYSKQTNLSFMLRCHKLQLAKLGTAVTPNMHPNATTSCNKQTSFKSLTKKLMTQLTTLPI